MADTPIYPILSVCATINNNVSNLPVKDAQLIFIKDKYKIALDYNGKRVFYDQIKELKTEEERLALLAPVSGLFYFVVNTATLWMYSGEWIQITTPPKEIIYHGVNLPEQGVTGVLYIHTVNEDNDIYIWDENTSSYMCVVSSKNAASGQGRAVCNSVGETLAKTASLEDYICKENSIVAVYFLCSVPANSTLNINNCGAKPICFREGRPIVDGIINASDTVTFIYSNGSYHVLSIDYDIKNVEWELTDSSKQEIVNLVLEALPAAEEAIF